MPQAPDPQFELMDEIAPSGPGTEPALITGGVLALLGLFGVVVSPDDVKAIIGAIVVIVPLVQALLTRRKVVSVPKAKAMAEQAALNAYVHIDAAKDV